MSRTVRTKLSGSSDRRRDRMSDLPDEVLVQILVLLPLVEAVRTCVLSHRWRHVWRRLPLLEFADDEDAPEVSSFADLVAGVILGYAPDVHMPDVSVSVTDQYEFAEAVRIAASAFLAAQRAISTFDLFVDVEEDEVDAEEVLQAPPLLVPCFPWVTELSLTFPWVDLQMISSMAPYTLTFARLTKLYIFGVRFTDEGRGISDVVSGRCPCLRDLELHTIGRLTVLLIVSQSLLTLRLFRLVDLERLLVVGPQLREMQVTLSFVLASEPTLLLLQVPELEQFHWEDRCPDEIHRWSLPNELSRLTVIELPPAYLIVCDGGQSRFTSILQTFERITTLSLEFPIAPESAEQRNLIENADISFFRELDLNVTKTEHIFGPTVLRLLKRHKWLRKLSLKITDDREDHDIITPCASNCDCQQVQNGRDNMITLDYLNLVVMKNFGGTKDEMKFLISIVQIAKALRKVSIVSSVGVEPTEKFLQTIKKQSPSGCTIELATI